MLLPPDNCGFHGRGEDCFFFSSRDSGAERCVRDDIGIRGSCFARDVKRDKRATIRKLPS